MSLQVKVSIEDRETGECTYAASVPLEIGAHISIDVINALQQASYLIVKGLCRDLDSEWRDG